MRGRHRCGSPGGDAHGHALHRLRDLALSSPGAVDRPDLRRQLVQKLHHVRHLAKRFAGSLFAHRLSTLDDILVSSLLGPGEMALWRRMSRADQAHAAAVAARVVEQLGPVEARPLLPAALLHDVGKVDSGLGTWARAGATIVSGVWGWERASKGDGRMARYLRHAEIGARLLEDAGADPLTVTWATEHHLPPERWTLDRAAADALKSADDD